MKIQPRKTASVPKYAAVLASAVLLTGCGYDEPVATDGTAPAPDPAVELMGEAQMMPEMTTERMPDSGTAPYDDGGDVTYTGTVKAAPDDKPQLVGLMQTIPDPEDDPVMLEGDVVFCPDFQQEEDALNDQLDALSEAYQTQFNLLSNTRRDCAMTKSGRRVCYFGVDFTEALENTQQNAQVIFFDGSAEEQGVTMREWLSGQCTVTYDWGCMLEQLNVADGINRVLFVDVSRENAASPEDASQIAEDAAL